MVQLHTAEVMRQSIEASKAGHMLMSLALLPSVKIETGLDVIKMYIGANNLEEEFRDILEYMDNFWIATIGVNRMSVADQPHRTNNALEGFYSRLLELMGAHPGVWKFHDKLRDIEMSQWFEYSRMVSGVRHVRPLRRVYARQNAAIFEATEMLRLNQYNLAEFLSRISHTTRGLTVRLHGGAAQAGQAAAEPMMPPPPPDQVVQQLQLPVINNNAPAAEVVQQLQLPVINNNAPAAEVVQQLQLPVINNNAPAAEVVQQLQLPVINNNAPAAEVVQQLQLPVINNNAPAAEIVQQLQLPVINNNAPAAEVVQQLQLPVINNNAPAAADPHNQPRRGRGGGRRGGGGGRRGGGGGRRGGGGGRRGGAVRGREMREPDEGQAIDRRGGGGNDLEFLQEPWPMDQAEHLSQRQVECLAAIPIEEDDAVAGEDDLACITCGVHKRSYITEPCGHFVMCGRCVSVHRHTVHDNELDVPLPITCPVCRRTLAGYRRIYQ